VPADTPGLEIAERIEVMAPHPLARLRFDACRIPADLRLGDRGQGLQGSRCGRSTSSAPRWLPRRSALPASGAGRSRAHATTRRMFGQRLADFQLTQAKLADMALPIDAAALLTYRAAWVRDQGARHDGGGDGQDGRDRVGQQVIDAAVQIFGGRGVRVSEEPVERLYRDIRACASTKAQAKSRS
jgi:acyl-CoA dehydrogenase